MVYFMNFYYKNYYMFTVYILPSLFYSAKILLDKYKPNEVKLIRVFDFLIFGSFLFQVIIIRLFSTVELLFINIDKYLFSILYNEIIVNSIWSVGFIVFMTFHLLNKKINNPIFFIGCFIVIVFCYFYFLLNFLFS